MSSHQCLHCEEALSFIEHAQSPYCEKPLCQRAKVQLYLVENKKHLTVQLSAELKKQIQSTPARKLPSRLRKALKKSSPVILLLPANTNQLTELSQEKKTNFIPYQHDI
jgi:hypothetical protein